MKYPCHNKFVTVALLGLMTFPAWGMPVQALPISLPGPDPGSVGLPDLPELPSLGLPVEGPVPCPKALLPINDALVPPDFFDYGDAPDSKTGMSRVTWYNTPGAPYGAFPTIAPTTNGVPAGQPGARHRVVHLGWLGPLSDNSGFAIPTREKDADLLPDQDLSGTNLQGAIPDKDGRDDGLVAATLVQGSPGGTLTFRVSSLTGFQGWYINAAIDWNFNGQWRGIPGTTYREWMVQNMVVSAPPVSSNFWTSPGFPVPTLLTGTPWVRVTLSNSPISAALYGGYGWDGTVPPGTYDAFGQRAWSCGETEDYCGRVSVKFSDLPDQKVKCVPVGHGGCEGATTVNITNMFTWNVNGVEAPSPYTSQLGFNLPATPVALYGWNATFAYQCLKTMTVYVSKVYAPPGTSSVGLRDTRSFSPSPACSSGTQTEFYPPANPVQPPYDLGDYDVRVVWNGCNGGGTYNGRLIVVPP
jgi:hypothetical protein